MQPLSEDELRAVADMYEKLSKVVMASGVPMEVRRKMLVRIVAKQYLAILISERVAASAISSINSSDIEELRWLFGTAVDHELESLVERRVITPPVSLDSFSEEVH